MKLSSAALQVFCPLVPHTGQGRCHWGEGQGQEQAVWKQHPTNSSLESKEEDNLLFI